MAKKIIKKPAIDLLEQMVKTGQPVTKKTTRKKKMSTKDLKEKEINESLLEIYQNKKGETVNVQKIIVRRRRWWMRIVIWLINLSLMAGLAWFGYNYYTSYRAKDDLLIINIETDKNLAAGQEFSYRIDYYNNGPVDLVELEININLPETFILTETNWPVDQFNTWHLDRLPARSTETLIISGKIINKIGESNKLEVSVGFRPINLSSVFIATQSHDIVLTDPGLVVNWSVPNVLAINRDNEASFSYQLQNDQVIDNLQLVISNYDWADIEIIDESNNVLAGHDGRWDLPINGQALNNLQLIIKPEEEAADWQMLGVELLTNLDQKTYLIDQRDFDFQLINSQFNLLLKINESNADSPVIAGQTMNYQLDYINQGEVNLKDVQLVVVLQGSWLDWESLNGSQGGIIDGQTIVWSKKELPELALLKPGARGSVSFSINLQDWSTGDRADSGEVVSYAYYQADEDTASRPSDDQKSNLIINQLSSDLELSEMVLYFNEDNIAVGSGPLPMVSGQTTNLKVYWRLSNTRHDLKDLQVITELPDYVDWAGKQQVSTGQLNYDPVNHQMIWQIDRLSASQQGALAEFSVAITPLSEQVNQIIIILPGSSVAAIDTVTQGQVEFKSGAKTSQLVDDQIVETDGLVQ